MVLFLLLATRECYNDSLPLLITVHVYCRIVEVETVLTGCLEFEANELRGDDSANV